MLAIELRGKLLKHALPAEIANRLCVSPKSCWSTEAETQKISLDLGSNQYYFITRLQALPDESGNGRSIVAQMRDVSHLTQEEARQKTMLETLNLLEEAVVDLSRKAYCSTPLAPGAKLRDIDPTNIERDYGRRLIHWIANEDRDKLQTAIDILAQTDEQTNSVRFPHAAAKQ